MNVEIPAPNEGDIVYLVMDGELEVMVESEGYPDGYLNGTVDAWYFRNNDSNHADIVVNVIDFYVRAQNIILALKSVKYLKS